MKARCSALVSSCFKYPRRRLPQVQPGVQVRDRRFLALGAGDTARCRRIKRQPGLGDIIATILAIAEFPLIHTPQGHLEPGLEGLTTQVAGLGHGLILQSIHSAQPAHGLLIKLDRGLSRLAKCILLRQFCEQGVDPGAKSALVVLIHFAYAPDHAFAFY